MGSSQMESRASRILSRLTPVPITASSNSRLQADIAFNSNSISGQPKMPLYPTVNKRGSREVESQPGQISITKLS